MEPARTLYFFSSDWISGTSALPLGRSQRTCRATVGLTPVRALTCAGVGEFLFDGGGRGGLDELAEAGAGIGESPGWDLDAEFVQRAPNFVGHAVERW